MCKTYLKLINFIIVLVLANSSWAELGPFNRKVDSSYPPKNEDIEVQPFLNTITNLPETWSLFKDELVAPQNRDIIINLSFWTAFTVATDYQTWQFFKKHHVENSWVYKMNFHFVSAGDGFFQFAMAGAFAGYGYLSDDNLALRTAHQITEVILATGAVVQLMKHVTGRESPLRTTTKTGNWEPFPEQVKYHRNVQKYDAVPSGHLATAYATFLVVWDNYPKQTWIPWVGYPVIAMIAAGLTGTSLHWVSDYPYAIGLGHVFAKIVTRKNHPEEETSTWTPHLVPIAQNNGPPLLGLRWSW